VLAAFLVGFAGAGFFLQRLFVENARQQVLEDARIMMTAANAVRHFTNVHIKPLAAPINEAGDHFVSASVPSFAAQTTFKDVQAQFPDFTYREPALNPTNLSDRATDWEADYIETFRNRPDLKELSGERQTPTGAVLTLVRPIAILSPDCLTCHSTPAAAPKALIAAYGATNGFGWHLNDVVGAQVVQVPMALPLQQAQRIFLTFMAILLGVFVLIVVILNVLLHYTVIRPVMRLSHIANAVSLGEPGVEDYERKGNDEIAILAASFTRMRRSLDSAMSMLER